MNAGGSYRRDPDTGEVTLIERTSESEPGVETIVITDIEDGQPDAAEETPEGEA